MDVKNIYYLYGFVNVDGTFVNNPNYKTYVAECKIGNNNGYSFYSFLTVKTINYNEKTTEKPNTNIIKLENLIDLIEDPSVTVKKIDPENAIKYKDFFELLYNTQENFWLEETGRKNV